MKSLTAVFGILMLGSILSPAAGRAEVVSRPMRSAQPLTAAVRAAFHQGNASYLHGAMASALGMDAGNDDAISVYQREMKAGDHGGRLIAVTLLEKRGRHQIVFASWNKDEVLAYLTSETGVLKKAVRGTKEGGWEPLPANAAQTGFATEKKYWVGVADAAPQSPAKISSASAGTRADR